MSIVKKISKDIGKALNTGLGGAPGGGGGGGVAPDFHALAPDTSNDYKMEGVLVGTGSLTSTHTSTLYAADKDGVYQQFPANEAVWTGGRAVLDGAAGTDVDTYHGNSSASGPALSEAPYLQYYPAATNVCFYSRDLTNAAWFRQTATVAYNQTGITGEPNTATLFTRVAGSGSQFVDSASGTTNSEFPCTFVIYAKKEAASNSWLHVSATGLNPWCQFDLVNGVTGPDSGTIDAKEIIDIGGGWYKCLLQVSVGFNIRLWPFGDQPSAVQPPQDDLPGSVIIGNVEVHRNKTIAQVRGLGPIFTTTAAVTTDAIDPQSADDANHSDTEGGYYLEFTPSVATSEISGDHQLLSLNAGADLLYYDATNSQVESADGTNTGVKSLTLVSGTTYQIGLAFGSSNMRINVDGTWGTAASYDGAYPTGTVIEILNALSTSGKIRNLRFYSQSYADAQTTIDGLMP